MDSIHRKDLVATPVTGLSGLAGSNSTGSFDAALRSLTRWSGKGLMKSIAVLALALTAQLAAAQGTYPNKALRIVVPGAVGSLTDQLARIIGEPLSKSLGQPVIVENKPGAGATLGTDQVAKAAPDGYTLLLGNNSAIAAGPAGLWRSVSYDPLKDLQPLIRTNTAPYTLVSAPNFPAKTFPELVAYIKANPGKVNFGTGSGGAIIYMQLIRKLAGGLDVLHVPYKGNPAATIDLLGGQIQLLILDVGNAAPRVRSGHLRAYAVTSQAADFLLPGLPKLSDFMPAMPDLSAWGAFYLPAGTPKPIVDRLHGELLAVLRSPDTIQRIKTLGMAPTESTVAELDMFTRQQIEIYRRIIQEFRIEPEG
jgi:tripartite-type tricarboxylate transporter receptor subunit TctC